MKATMFKLVNISGLAQPGVDGDRGCVSCGSVAGTTPGVSFVYDGRGRYWCDACAGWALADITRRNETRLPAFYRWEFRPLLDVAEREVLGEVLASRKLSIIAHHAIDRLVNGSPSKPETVPNREDNPTIRELRAMVKPMDYRMPPLQSTDRNQEGAARPGDNYFVQAEAMTMVSPPCRHHTPREVPKAPRPPTAEDVDAFATQCMDTIDDRECEHDWNSVALGFLVARGVDWKLCPYALLSTLCGAEWDAAKKIISDGIEPIDVDDLEDK